MRDSFAASLPPSPDLKRKKGELSETGSVEEKRVVSYGTGPSVPPPIFF